ncbi:heme-copper oxidase subunit III [Phormidium sp. LEGE 05292]|uniref:cytochrome c oxidase subunit 3 n=1 Tax=[Phormidium] sp. LEGE 05292 TaxID=767427 RepID=UPI001880E7FB|nr:heme-copper oxidase subunit III [Phormidium sp. LEGE 05292]MBE9227952.1 heme-copper oxidase subunit III [Phormidium sp. LEGE 05292]
MSSSPNTRIHVDESPIDLERLRQKLPDWLKRFLPSGGGSHEDHHGKGMFGVTIFLLSESIVFLSFFFSYIVLRLTTPKWLPPGVSGPIPSTFVVINTIILLSSSVVIQLAERALSRHHLNKFRLLWLMTALMGTYFLIGQGIEWKNLDFGLRTGLVGATFYILTGFHGLHVFSGVILQVIMLVRSLLPNNYNNGHFGVSATTLFWHFVDVIWVILFSLLYIW